MRVSAALLLALVGVCAALPPFMPKIEFVEHFETSLGNILYVSYPSTLLSDYPDGVRSAFSLEDPDASLTADLLGVGKFNDSDVYSMYTPDAFALPNNTILYTPIYGKWQEHLTDVPLETQYVPIITRLYITNATDGTVCQSNTDASCVSVGFDVVDVDNDRCAGSPFFGELLPCYAYVDDADCAAYNTTDGNPSCGNNVTVNAFADGVWAYETYANMTTSLTQVTGCSNLLTNEYNATTGVLSVAVDKTIVLDYVAASTAASISLFVHVAIRTVSVPRAYNGTLTQTFQATTRLIVLIDSDTGALMHDEHVLSFHPILSASSRPTAVFNGNQTAETFEFEYGVRNVAYVQALESTQTALVSSILSDARFASVATDSNAACAGPAATPLPYATECQALLENAVSTVTDNTGKSTVVNSVVISVADIDQFYLDIGYVGVVECDAVVQLSAPNGPMPVGNVAVTQRIEIEPPDVSVCTETENVQYLDSDGVTTVSTLYDEFADSGKLLWFGLNGNFTYGVKASVSLLWRGVAYQTGASCVNYTATEDIKSCAADLYNAERQDVLPIMMPDKTFNDTALAQCTGKTEYDVTFPGNCTRPDVTVTCDVCGLTVETPANAQFLYTLSACNYEPCSHAAGVIIDFISLHPAKMCAKWDDIGYFEDMTISLNVSAKMEDMSVLTRSMILPVNVTCEQIGCHNFGYDDCTLLRKRSESSTQKRSWFSDVVDTVKDIVEDTIGGKLPSFDPFARRSLARSVNATASVYDDMLYWRLDFVDGRLTAGFDLTFIRNLLASDVNTWIDTLNSTLDVPSQELQNIVDNLYFATPSSSSSSGSSGSQVDVPSIPLNSTQNVGSVETRVTAIISTTMPFAGAMEVVSFATTFFVFFGTII